MKPAPPVTMTFINSPRQIGGGSHGGDAHALCRKPRPCWKIAGRVAAPLWPNYRFRSRASILGGRPAPVVRRSQVPNYEGDAIMLASDTRCRAGGMWIYCCDLLRARNSGAPGYLL